MTPNANIAIATGSVSGIVVIDVDAHDGIDGEASLTELTTRFGPLPDTVEQQMGGGGRQLFFRDPGVSVPSATSFHGQVGVDIRGEGGYVVAPPSMHPSGKQYTWELSGDPTEGVELAELPERWVRALTARAPRSPSNSTNGRIGEGRRAALRDLGTPLRPPLDSEKGRAD